MIRPYDADRDAEALWACKRAFELGLGSGTGDDGKAAAYRAKLTDGYRERYLDWVARCVDREPRAVQVAPADGGNDGPPAAGADDAGGPAADDAGGPAAGETGAGGTAADRPDPGSRDAGDAGLAGYVFVLPADLAMIWDAAVLNEIYVRPAERGTGVADDLVAAAVDVASAQSLPIDRLVLDVDRENERARAFYRRHGFEHWGEMVARPLD